MLLSAGRFPLSNVAFTVGIFLFLLVAFDQLETSKKLPLDGLRGTNKYTAATKARTKNEPWTADKPQSRHSQKTIQIDEYMRDMLKWERPKDKEDHWPQYSAFEGRDYDVNRWEGFPQ
jgi:hypothetical protein